MLIQPSSRATTDLPGALRDWRTTRPAIMFRLLKRSVIAGRSSRGLTRTVSREGGTPASWDLRRQKVGPKNRPLITALVGPVLVTRMVTLPVTSQTTHLPLNMFVSDRVSIT